jgi:hypothetical protein
MSKKRLYLIIAITAIITIGFFLAAYIISKNNSMPADQKQENPFANFFPFGKGSGDNKRTNTDNTDFINGTSGDANNPIINPKNLLALRQVSNTATAGMFPLVKSGKTVVQFVERATGNVYETTMEDMRKDRLSNILIPGVQEVFWGDNGKSVVYRYIKEGGVIITYVMETPNPNRFKVEAQSATTTDPVKGSFLTEDISNVLISSDTKNIFYLTKTPDFSTRVALGNIFNFTKNTSTRVFQSPFSEWLPVYFDGKTVLLQTKASQNVPGYLYSVSLPSGEPQKIIGGINGLTALPSPDLRKILYSESTRGGIILHLYDRKEKKTLDISLVTLPEKCAWNADSVVLYCAAPDYLPTAEYPDAWYQGSISFGDTVWKIDANTGDVVSIFTPETFGAPKLDMGNLILSPSRDFLFFINKNDSTLWGYDLTH